jgi:trigger factor
MADTKLPPSDDPDAAENDTVAENDTAEENDAVAEDDAVEESQKLDLDVSVEQRGSCQRHITVSVSREDIDRYFDQEFSEIMTTAQVPGFRSGRAPRKLVESRFRKDVSEKVKSEILMDSLSQVNEEEEFSAISEPDIDPEAVELPDEGAMTFEFDLEVRPEFEVPKWKGLSIKRPVREFTDKDVDRALQDLLSRQGRLVPSDDPAEEGDYITVNLTFKHGDDVLSHAEEEVIRIRPALSFRDGKIDTFGQLMSGAKGGDTVETEVKLSDGAPNEALRGQKVKAVFDVLEVKKLELPELTEEFLDELGGFELEADLRDGIRDQLERQLEYEQHRQARQQVTKALTVAADWDLPPELLKRQSGRELERAVMELQRSGFSEEDIRAHENELRQNSEATTAMALKEHFILERIAEDEEVEADEADYDQEIKLIASNAHESPRRVRARLEKSGSMDVLRNEIIERKVVELILEQAKFKEVPYEVEETDTSAMDQAAGGHQESDIPEAKFDSAEAAPGGRPKEAPERD